MPRGLPDDGDVLQIGDLYRLLDMSELAVRLESIVSYHRWGSVVYLDTFRNGLAAWDALSYGVGGHVWLSNLSAASYGVSVEMETGTGALPYAYIQKTLPSYNSAKYGFSLAFTLSDLLDDLQFQITAYDGAYEQDYRIRFVCSTNSLEVWLPDGTWETFATLPIVLKYEKMFHVMKMIIDMENAEYRRFFFNQLSYDLSAYAPRKLTYVSNPFLRYTVYAVGGGSLSAAVYVDNAIMTINEYA
jgi:hypothetical protein